MIESRVESSLTDLERNSTPKWVYESSHYRPRWHYLVYRDESLGVQMQIATRWRNGRFGNRHVTTYYLDGEDRVFRSEEKLMQVLEARRKRLPEPAARNSRSPLRKMAVSFSHMMGLW